MYKVFEIHTLSCKYFEARESWCKLEERIMSCELGILRR